MKSNSHIDRVYWISRVNSRPTMMLAVSARECQHVVILQRCEAPTIRRQMPSDDVRLTTPETLVCTSPGRWMKMQALRQTRIRRHRHSAGVRRVDGLEPKVGPRFASKNDTGASRGLRGLADCAVHRPFDVPDRRIDEVSRGAGRGIVRSCGTDLLKTGLFGAETGVAR